jgi:predicted transcriptional regulator of viral defense system
MTYREQLREVAEERYGYVTTRDLGELKIPPVELRKLAARGKLEHVRRGVYRFPDTRPTERDEFMAAVMCVGDGAFLTHDAVLALHGLGLVNPKKIRVATPHRIRHKIPNFVEVHQRTLPANEVEVFEAIPTTRVARAIIDSCGLVMTERLKEALAVARRQGLVTRKEAIQVRKALREVTVK